MATLRFRIVNVFTQDQAALTGNPLCVFEDGRALDATAMQALARQFNLSETTFILPSTSADARVRIFTPNYELPFAGHPTLGTAHVCRALGIGGDSLRLEMQTGLINVVAQEHRWTLTAPTPTWRELDLSRSVLAQALGLAERDIDERPLWMKAGREQLVVPLTSPDAVRRAAPQFQSLQNIRSDDEIAMIYLFAATGGESALARFFFPQGAAILEDPATGSATANFGGWCLAMQRPLPIQLQISQGEAVERPSTLFLQVDARGNIFVSGDVIQIAQGSLEFP